MEKENKPPGQDHTSLQSICSQLPGALYQTGITRPRPEEKHRPFHWTAGRNLASPQLGASHLCIPSRPQDPSLQDGHPMAVFRSTRTVFTGSFRTRPQRRTGWIRKTLSTSCVHHRGPRRPRRTSVPFTRTRSAFRPPEARCPVRTVPVRPEVRPKTASRGRSGQRSPWRRG